jgi:hypothetical protein
MVVDVKVDHISMSDLVNAFVAANVAKPHQSATSVRTSLGTTILSVSYKFQKNPNL